MHVHHNAVSDSFLSLYDNQYSIRSYNSSPTPNFECIRFDRITFNCSGVRKSFHVQRHRQIQLETLFTYQIHTVIYMHTYIYIYREREMNNNVVITGMVMTEVTINYINKYTDVYDQHNYQNDLI